MSYALLAHIAANGSNGGALTAAGADNTFGQATITTELQDEDTIVTLSSNQFTLALGDYRIRAVISFGVAAANDGVMARAGLYSISAGAFKTYKGGAVEIIGSAGVTAEASTGDMNGTVEIMGRFEVTDPAEVFAIYMAGDSVTGTWYTQTYAQGKAATSITTGSKSEVYKLIEILKE